MTLQLREQIQGLETINAKRLKEIFIGSQLFPRNLEMSSGEFKDFVYGLVRISHGTRFSNTNLWQIRLRFPALNKFAKAGFNGRLRKQIAENVDFLLQFFIRNRLDEFLGARSSVPVKFRQLNGGASCYA